MQIKQLKSIKLKKEHKLNNGVTWQGAFTVKGRKRIDRCVTV